MLSLVPLVVVGLASGAPDLGLLGFDVKDLSPTAFVVVNLSLIALIPVSALSIWIVHQIRPRYLSSVAGGIRWRWLARSTLVVLPLWLTYLALGLLLAPAESARPEQWLSLLIIVLIMTPFQAAGEEYFFRGWLMQNVGAYFARPMLGLVVSVTVSSVVFAAAHGSPDPWVLGSIGCFAVAAGVAAYRTGGLEAGIAMHAVNNMLAFGAVLLFGGWEEAFVGADIAGHPGGPGAVGAESGRRAGAGSLAGQAAWHPVPVPTPSCQRGESLQQRLTLTPQAAPVRAQRSVPRADRASGRATRRSVVGSVGSSSAVRAQVGRVDTAPAARMA